MNRRYDLGSNAIARGEMAWKASGGMALKAFLIDLTLYTPNFTTDQYLSDVPTLARIGNLGGHALADAIALTLIDPVLGVCDASDITFPAVPVGSPLQAILLFVDGGSDAASPLHSLVDGKVQITAAANASIGATTITVDPLKKALPVGGTMTFSGSAAATLSAAASEGARSISVNALAAAVAAGETAEPYYVNASLPVTPDGNDILCRWDNGSNKILKI